MNNQASLYIQDMHPDILYPDIHMSDASVIEVKYGLACRKHCAPFERIWITITINSLNKAKPKHKLIAVQWVNAFLTLYIMLMGKKLKTPTLV